ncbi:MAG TPA: mechanosensitive ion channel domain-containing protein [Thermomonas sp.]|nr:mechanosensitive ion channel domain-containing protein [Thermomonas sp.]
MPILDPAKLPTASSLGERFMTALEQVQDKLLHLVASIPLLVVALLIVLLASWLGGVASRRMRFVKRISSSNPYMEGLLRSTVRFLIVLAGVVVALDLLNATSLVGAVLGSAGVIGLVLGFGFKDIAENYIAGVLLSLRKPFSPGDTVRIDTFEGKVVALTARATILMTVDGNHLQLPNGIVFKSVLLNYSRNPKRRFDFETGIENCASWHAAMEAGIAAIASVDGVLADPAPSSIIRSLSNDGATLQFAGWIDQGRNDLARTRSEAMRRVRSALRQRDMLPPDTVQKVVLLRSGVDPVHAAEPEHPRDTSVDHTLDAQVGHARRQEDDGDLLYPQPPAQP